MYGADTAPSHGHRIRIQSFVGEHPGSYLSEIERDLHIATGVAQYHLHVLERSRWLVSRRFGRLKRYYAAAAVPERDLPLLDALLRESEREILLHLLHRPGLSQADLSRRLEVAAPTISWHMTRLRAAGFVEAERRGRTLAYTLRIPPGEIHRLLSTYRPGLLRIWVDRFEGLLDAMTER
jgi:predicted transcriptional regulator